jgi:antitoxin (DNA-binding transcriptional repressor) of toxin-antitoxin stability system
VAPAELNEFLRRVANGETIRITRHGIPLAKIVPLDGEGEKDKDEERFIQRA